MLIAPMELKFGVEVGLLLHAKLPSEGLIDVVCVCKQGKGCQIPMERAAHLPF